MRRLALVAVLLVGCQSDEPARRSAPSPPPLPSAETRAIPPLARRVCRASRLLRPVCPSRVPAGSYPRSGFFLSPIGPPGSRYDVFELNGSRRVVLFASRYGLGKRPLAHWPASADPVRWGGRKGELALLKGHLFFRWQGRGVDYAVAVRTWKPRPEAVATLRAIVVSMPR